MSKRFEEDLAGLERELGRISMFLQCGEYDGKDLARERKALDDCQLELAQLIEDTDDALERAGEDTRMGQRYAQELGEMEDAVSPLDMADEALLTLIKSPHDKAVALEAISQLDSACEALTRAMKVWK